MAEKYYRVTRKYVLADGTIKTYQTRVKKPIKTKHIKKLTITDDQKKDILDRFNLGVTCKRLSIDFNISEYYVRKIVNSNTLP
jgi:hypothetical protein